MGDVEARVIEREEREFIEAEFVNIKQSSVRSVEGGHVELHQVGALSIDGERVEVTQGVAAVINGGDVSFNQGNSLVTVSERTTLTSSCSPVLLSMESTDVSRSAVGILGGREIKADNVSSFLMIANKTAFPTPDHQTRHHSLEGRTRSAKAALRVGYRIRS